MAEILGVTSFPQHDVIQIIWSHVTESDTCLPSAIGSLYPNRVVQVSGTWDSADFALEGSLDDDVYDPLLDQSGSAIHLTADSVSFVLENTNFIQPVITTGGSSQDLTVIFRGTVRMFIASGDENTVLVSGGFGTIPTWESDLTLDDVTMDDLTCDDIDAGDILADTVSSPVVLGGSAVDATLTLKSTSGVGTTDAIALKVGSNGGTTGLTISHAGTMVVPRAIDLSSIAAGSPAFKVTATNDTPTVTFDGDGTDGFTNTTAPAGYLEILVGSTPYYIPFWA